MTELETVRAILMDAIIILDDLREQKEKAEAKSRALDEAPVTKLYDSGA